MLSVPICRGSTLKSQQLCAVRPCQRPFKDVENSPSLSLSVHGESGLDGNTHAAPHPGRPLGGVTGAFSLRWVNRPAERWQCLLSLGARKHGRGASTCPTRLSACFWVASFLLASLSLRWIFQPLTEISPELWVEWEAYGQTHGSGREAEPPSD